MSVPQFSLQSAVDRVDHHLRDQDGATAAFSPWEKEAVIEAQMRLLAGELLLGEQWSSSLVTLVVGTDTYTLPTATTQDYERLKRLRLQLNGLEIPIVSLEVFETFREGETTATRGTPQVAMVIQEPSSAPKLRFWPTPDQASVVDGFFTLLPATFAHDETASIPFDELAFEALCYASALELWNRMPQGERDRRNLGPDTPALWGECVVRGVRASRHRRRRQQGGDVRLMRRRW